MLVILNLNSVVSFVSIIAKYEILILAFYVLILFLWHGLKVLRILEGGDMMVDSGSDAGSRSWRVPNEHQRYQEQSSPAQHDSQRANETARSPWGKDGHNLSHRY